MKLRSLLFALICASNIVAMAQQKDDLQEFINNAMTRNQTRGNGVTIVDLSQFSTTVRTNTLELSTGGSFLFINGTLSRAESLDETLISVSNGSSIELGENCIISGGGLVNGNALITLNNGALKVSAGEIIDNFVNKEVTANGMLYSKISDCPVMLSNNLDQFIMTGGTITSQVECIAANAKIEISGGSFIRTTGSIDSMSIVTSSAVTLGGSADISDIQMNTAKPIYLTSGLTHDINLYYNTTDINEGSVIIYGKDYDISQQDVDRITGLERYKSNPNIRPIRTYTREMTYQLKLKNNQIYLTKKIDNVIDLQTKLNEIAEKGTATVEKPEVIVIADEGLLIDKYLKVKKNCHAMLTGGPLRISSEISDHYCIFIDKDASLTLNNITVDLMNNSFKSNSGIFYINGTLKIGSTDENVEFVNTPTVMGRYGEAIFQVNKNASLFLNDGTIETYDLCIVNAEAGATIYINGAVLSNNATVINGDGIIYLLSGKIAGSYSIIIANSIYVTGNSMIIEDFTGEAIFMRAETVMFEHNCNFIGKYNKIVIDKNVSFWGDMEIPTIYIGNSETFDMIILYSQLVSKNGLEIDAADWTKIQQDKALIVGEGYKLTNEDFKKIKFLNLPSVIEAYYDDTDYSVKLRRKAFVDDLQDFINNSGYNNGTGTEDDPIKANISCDGVDVNDGLMYKDDLQYFISGKQPVESECQGSIYQNEGNVTIPSKSTVTYTNLYLYGCGCQNYVYVYGTLILDYNIYIYNYLRFIHLKPGGRIIIRGIDGEVEDEIFYLEGGTVEFHDGNVTGGKYGWWNTSGTIYIYNGTISGGIHGGYTASGGTSYIYNGTVDGGIQNHGVTYIHNGTITGGTDYTIHNHHGGTIYIYGGTCSAPGTIWNAGTIYLDGSKTVNINEIHAASGCRIYLISKLTYILRLHITVENIMLNTPIIMGEEGYTLTEEDCKMINITLPKGYNWRFDAAAGGIVIYSTTAVSDINTNPTVESTYNVSGVKVHNNHNGINLQRMNDGTVKKIFNK